MNESDPIQSRPRGNAVSQAKGILSAYFADSAQAVDTPTSEKEDMQADAVETEQETRQPTEEAPEQEQAARPDTNDSEIEDTEEERYTLAELAQSMELDPATLYAAEIPLPDGTRIKLGEAKDLYQNGVKLNREAEQAAKHWENQRAAIENQQAMLQQQAQLLSLGPDDEERKLYEDHAALSRAERDKAYWDQAGQQDAGKAALALNQVAAAKRELEQKIQAKQQERQQKAQEYQQEIAQRAQQEIARRIGDWNDADTREKDWQDIAVVGQKYGLTEPELRSLWMNPAVIHIFRDYVGLLRKVGVAKPERKKMRSLKSLQPGSRKSSSLNREKEQKLERLSARAKKGDRRAQVEAAKILIGG